MHGLTSLLGGPLWNADVDDGARPDLVSALADATGTPGYVAHATTLASFAGRLFREHRVGRNPWILHVTAGHRRHWRAGLQGCPTCLHRRGYFKKVWRLGFVTTCPQHKLILIDRCSWCEQPLRVWEPRIQSISPASACVRCKMPLTQRASASDSVLAFQEYLITMAQSGIALDGRSSIAAFESLRECCVIQLMSRMVRSRANASLEYLSTDRRHVLMEVAAASLHRG